MGGFLYRVEALDIFVSTPAVTPGGAFLSLRPDWLTSSSPDQPADPSFSWPLRLEQVTTSLIFERTLDDDGQQVRRTPTGASQAQIGADPASQLSLVSAQWIAQVDTAVYTMQVIASWWPMTVLSRPDFLQAFLESPTPLVATR